MCPSFSFFVSLSPILSYSLFFFFNDTATTEIYTLSLHDALPISRVDPVDRDHRRARRAPARSPIAEIDRRLPRDRDRKSTRLNSSHQIISYAVFCLKKKKRKPITPTITLAPASTFSALDITKMAS